MGIIWYVGSKLAKIINEIYRDTNKTIVNKTSKDKCTNNNKTRYYNNIHKRLIRRNFSHNKFIK